MLACSGGADLTNQGTAGSQPSQPSGSAAVTIQDFTFSPSAVNVKVGAAVRWVNTGPSAHTTTSDEGTWDSGQLNPPMGGGIYGGGSPGGSFQFTFNTPGTYRYHCSNHPPSIYPGFTGAVIVSQ
jgi:plastocyanin